MKLLLILLLMLPVVLAQECCTPEQYETYEGIYLGYTERNVPDFEPQASDGIAKLIYDFPNKKEKVLYLDIDLPGNENLEYILNDYAFNGTTTLRTFSGYDDGSCFYEDFPNAVANLVCWDSIYPLLAQTSLSTNVPAALYGFTFLNNYVIVRQSDCLPLANVAKQENAPEEGIYQWITIAYINTTLGISDPTELDPPTDCEPVQTPSRQLPMGFLPGSFMNTEKPNKKPNNKKP